MQAANRVAKNTLILYGRMAITVFISLYSTRLILSALGAADFGLFNVVAGAIVMLTFLNNAMAAATQRFMSYAQGEDNVNKQKSIFNVSIVLHFIIGLILVGIFEIAGYFFFNGVLNIDQDRIGVAKLIYQFMIISTFFKVLSVPYDAVINAHENMLVYSVIGVIESLFKLLIAILVTYTAFDKLIAYGLLITLLAVLLLFIQIFYCRYKYEEARIRINKHYDRALFKEMSSFGGWSLLGSAASLFANYGQTLIINIFFGTVVNAAQGVANQISGQLSAFSTTMIKALNPVIVKTEGAGNRSGMLKASMTGSKVSFALMAFFSVPAIIEMDYILALWLKDVPEFAVIFCKLLLIKGLIEQLFRTLATSISAAGKIKNYQISLSILAMLPLIMSYVLFDYGFPPATIYIVFIIQVLLRSFFIVLLYSKKLLGLSIKHFMEDVILKSLVAVAISTILAMAIKMVLDQGFIRLLLVILIHSISYIISIFFVGLNKEERQMVVSGVYGQINRIEWFKYKK